MLSHAQFIHFSASSIARLSFNKIPSLHIPLCVVAQVAFQAGQTIVKEGDVESKFFLMRAGSALVHSKSGGGEGIASSSSSSSPTKKKAAITPEPSGSPPPIVARHSPRTTAAASSGANMPTGEPMDLDLTHLGKLVGSSN